MLEEDVADAIVVVGVHATITGKRKRRYYCSW